MIKKANRQQIYGELVSLLALRGDLETALAIESLGTNSHTATGFPIPVIRSCCSTRHAVAYSEGTAVLTGAVSRIAIIAASPMPTAAIMYQAGASGLPVTTISDATMN